MSWAEAKKLNSDLTTPINLANLINHIDLVGDRYIGWDSIPLTVGILAGDSVYSHTIATTILADNMLANSTLMTAVINQSAVLNKCLRSSIVSPKIVTNTGVVDYIDSILGASTGVGSFLAFIASSNDATLIACNDMNSIVSSSIVMNIMASSSTAMNSIASNSTAMNSIASNSTAMDIILASSTATDIILASSTAMNSIASSSTAMNIIVSSSTVMNSIASSSTAMNSIASSSTAMNIILANSTAMNIIASSSTARNAIFASSTAMNIIAKSSDALDILAGIPIASIETDALWDTLFTALSDTTKFTDSGLLTDTGDGTTFTRTGDLITMITSAYSSNTTSRELSITAGKTGGYSHARAYNWYTGKHIEFGGHTSWHERTDSTNCYVQCNVFTPI